MLGPDHPDTLNSAHNLAYALRALGEVEAARDLDQHTLDIRGRVLGPDHPSTLASASNLAMDVRALREADEASETVPTPHSKALFSFRLSSSAIPRRHHGASVRVGNS